MKLPDWLEWWLNECLRASISGISTEPRRVFRIDGCRHQSAFHVDTSYEPLHASSTDNSTGSSSRGESKPHRCSRGLPGVPSSTTAAGRWLHSKAPTVLRCKREKCKSNPNFHHVASHKIRLKFHSPIAQTICTLNFILGLFASVTELRLAGVCFLYDARVHGEIAIHTRAARSELHFVVLFMLQFHNDTSMDKCVITGPHMRAGWKRARGPRSKCNVSRSEF